MIPTSPTIDRESRDIAARLVRQFLEGEISSDELENAWPVSKLDRALDEIAWNVWLFSDDFKPRRMTGDQAASVGEREILSRYAAFLDTDIPYDWPKPSLVDRFDQWVMSGKRLDAKMAAHGDLEAWPFTSKQQIAINSA